MEQLAQVIDGVLASQPENMQNRSESLNRWRETDSAERRAKVLEVVSRVELAKHLTVPLTPEQRAVLTDELCRQPWTLKDIERRGDCVMRSDTYGSIGFDR